MSRKSIETSREIRLWLAQIIGPIMGLVGYKLFTDAAFKVKMHKCKEQVISYFKRN